MAAVRRFMSLILRSYRHFVTDSIKCNVSISNIGKNELKGNVSYWKNFQFTTLSMIVMNSTIKEIFLQLLVNVRNDFTSKKKLSDKTLSMLSFLFDTTALQALELIDRQCIILIKSPSGRELYQIQRGTTDFHICLKNSNYCSCPAFFFQVLKGDQYMCKHKLATELCSSMGLCKEIQYSDETVSLMLAGES